MIDNLIIGSGPAAVAAAMALRRHKTVPLGRSFHIGGSFPMGGAETPFHSDSMGRPAGLKRVHLVDPSTFPAVPATTITYSIMANSDRIVSRLAKAG